MPPEADKTATKPKSTDTASDQHTNSPAPSPFHQELQSTQRGAAPKADAAPKASADAAPKASADAAPKAGTDAASKPADAAGPKSDAPAAPGGPASPPAEKPHLDQAVIDRKATELHDALLKKGWFGRSTPDKDAVTQALSGTSEADRKAIEAAYQTNWGQNGPADKLRFDLKQHLGDEDFRRSESTLNTHDGSTNDAGALMTAMTVAKKDQERGSNEVRAILQTLDSKTLDQVKTNFENTYHVKLGDALAKANLNDTTSKSLDTLMQGVDHITSDDKVKLAQIALKNNDERAFCEAIRGDDQTAKDARAKLVNDPATQRKIQEAFTPSTQTLEGYPVPVTYPTGQNWKSDLNPVVADYLNDGKISLKTVIDNNHPGWPFNNKENTELAARNASDSERQQFIQGKALADAKAANLTPDQQASVNYYNQVHSAFKNMGNDRETAALEDQLIHGRETIISQMASTHSDGWTGLHLFSSNNKEDLMGKVEHLSKEDWQLLSTKPQNGETQEQATKRSQDFKNEIGQSLDTYADPGEKPRIMAMLQQKSEANSYEDSQQVKRSLTDVIDSNTKHGFFGGTSYDTKNILNSLSTMSQPDVDKYNNPKPPASNSFREDTDKFVASNLQGAEQLEAKRLLAGVNDSGKPPVLDDTDKFLLAKVNGAEPTALVSGAEKVLADPAVRARLNQPDDKLSAQDKELKAQIQDASMRLEAQNQPPRGRGGYVPNHGPTAEDLNKALFQNGHVPADMKLSLGFDRKEVMSELPSAPADERAAAEKSFTPQETQVIEQAAQNPKHQLNLEDRMRLSAIDSKAAPSSADDIQKELSKLTNDEKIALKNDYAKKYGGGDLDTDFAKSLDNPGDKLKFSQLLATTDSDGRQKYYDNYDAMLKSESGLSLDGSKMTMERANDLYATSLQEYQKIYKTLPPEKQQALDKYFGDSMKQYRDSKAKLAEVVVDATITAAALAAAPFTAGASTLALMSTAAAFGATFRVAAMSAIEGNDFDSSGKNIAKQMVIGGTSAALNFFGGGEAAAAVGQAGKAITQEGAIAAAKIMAKEAVENGLIGAGSNVISDVAAAPFNKDGIDMKQLETSALTGLVAGAVIPVAFKGVLKAGGAVTEQIINLTKREDGLHIIPKNLKEPVSFKNAVTGEVRTFHPGDGEGMKLTKEWLPAEVAAGAAVAAAPVVAEVATHLPNSSPPEVSVPAPPTPAPTPEVAAPTQPIQPPPQQANQPLQSPGNTRNQPKQEQQAGVTNGAKLQQAPATKDPLQLASADVAGGNAQRIGSTGPSLAKPESTLPGHAEGPIESPTVGQPEQSPRGDNAETSEKPKAGDGSDRPVVSERPSVADAPPKLMSPDELKEFSEHISAQFADKPVSEQQFKDLFDGEYKIGGVSRKLTDNERQLVTELMQHSMPNLNNKQLNQQMGALKGELEKIPGWQWDAAGVNENGKWVKADGLKVFVLGGGSDGNALAHLMQKNTGVQVNIVTLEGSKLKDLQAAVNDVEKMQKSIKLAQDKLAADPNALMGKTPIPEFIAARQANIEKIQKDSGLLQAAVFDDLSQATPEQLKVLESVKRLALPDLNGFNHGPNILDMGTAGLVGNNDAVKEKLVTLMQKAEQVQAQQGLDAKAAVDKVLNDATANDAKNLLPDGSYHVVSPEAPPTREAARTETAKGLDAQSAEQYKEGSLYNEMTKPPVTPEQVETFLGKMSADQQRLAARLLREGLDVNTYRTMMDQAKNLQQQILEHIPGHDPKNMLILTNMEENGSNYMANSVFARANGLDNSNFVSFRDLERLKTDAAAEQLTDADRALMEQLHTKGLVYLEDYQISGQQMPKILDQRQLKTFEALQDSPLLNRPDGSPIFSEVTAGSLGRYNLPPENNPWKQFPSLNAAPGAERPGLKVNVVQSSATYDNLVEKPFVSTLGSTYEHQRLTTWATDNAIYPSSIASSMITPYGGPNNNIAYVQAFIESKLGLGLPQRYRKANWEPVITGEPYDKSILDGIGQP